MDEENIITEDVMNASEEFSGEKEIGDIDGSMGKSLDFEISESRYSISSTLDSLTRMLNALSEIKIEDNEKENLIKLITSKLYTLISKIN